MGIGPSLWRDAAPLLLASTSATRRMLLENAGLSVETEAPGVDERAVEAAAGASSPRDIALRLAVEKALAVSGRHPGRIIIGADQTLACEGRLLHKPAGRAAAQEQLAALSGCSHVLHSAFVIVRAGTVLHDEVAEARLTMRPLSTEDIVLYLDLTGEAAWRSVGAYQVEGLGIHLFEQLEGHHSTILGLPLLPLLAALREMELLTL